MNAESHDVTQLLKRWQLGDDDAPARLMPFVYEELRQLAHTYMQGEGANHRPRRTKPVHDGDKLFYCVGARTAIGIQPCDPR